MLRVHVVARCALFTPTGARRGPESPDTEICPARYLRSIPMAYLQTRDEARRRSGRGWPLSVDDAMGRSYRARRESRLPLELPTLYVEHATSLFVLAEPTGEERELRSVAQAPCQPWCAIGARSKGRAANHKRQVRRQPAAQVHYTLTSTTPAFTAASAATPDTKHSSNTNGNIDQRQHRPTQNTPLTHQFGASGSGNAGGGSDGRSGAAAAWWWEFLSWQIAD